MRRVSTGGVGRYSTYAAAAAVMRRGRRQSPKVLDDAPIPNHFPLKPSQFACMCRQSEYAM